MRGREYLPYSLLIKPIIFILLGDLMSQKFDNKLDEIIAFKREEIKQLLPVAEKLRYAAAERNEVRSFESALREVQDGELGLIAEVKKASPSAGIIATDFDPVAIAKQYNAAGVSAISVLTDEKYFQGNLQYLVQIREVVDVPVLRKDFIVHEVQIFEAVVAGADAVLLIVAALTQDELTQLLEVAHTYQLDVLVEVHNREELDRALSTDAKIIGVNNRNLRTFEVDLHTTERLSEEVPDDIILVSESGIKTPAEAGEVLQWGANAILVGESLMRSPDIVALAQNFRFPPTPDGIQNA
ncbi:MAG: indole-3-glycerol phosphate synthase [Verrucomicrobiales bacterium]